MQSWCRSVAALERHEVHRMESESWTRRPQAVDGAMVARHDRLATWKAYRGRESGTAARRRVLRKLGTKILGMNTHYTHSPYSSSI